MTTADLATQQAGRPPPPALRCAVIYLPDGDKLHWLGGCSQSRCPAISWRLQSKQPELIRKRSGWLPEARV